LKEQYGDLVYRPGEEFDFENLTEEEKTVRRKEIEELFSSTGNGAVVEVDVSE
jgi:hypothetical protein